MAELPNVESIADMNSRLLNNTQPTQAPDEFMMSIGEYGGVMPRNYLHEAQQMAADTSGIMGMSFPYNKMPLKKVKEIYEKLRVDFNRQIKLTENIDPNERAAAQRAVKKIKDEAVKVQEAINKKQ